MANINEIETNLWAMANNLRGNMDASEYKFYILAFMFYRFLSEKQNAYVIEQEIVDVEDPAQAPMQMMEDIFGTDDIAKIKKEAAVSRNFTRLYIEKKNANDEVVRDKEGNVVMEPVGSWVEIYKEYLEDIARSLGYFIPPLYSWTMLEKMLHNSMLIPADYQAMFDAFNFSLKYNTEAEVDFKGIFNEVNLGDSKLGNSVNERAKSLSSLIDLVNNIQYAGDNGEDILGQIYEYLIKQFAASAGKKSGEFYTPHEVSELMAQIVTYGQTDTEYTFTVFDPTCGSGSLLLTVGSKFPKNKGAVRYYGQEKNTTTYNIARMNLLMNNVAYEDMHLRNADTLGADWPLGIGPDGLDHYRTFDAVVANPPYSLKWDAPESYIKDKRFKGYGKLAPKSRADFAFLLDGFYHLNNHGTMAIVLPHGVLFRGAAEGVIRKQLIENGSIDAVIGLPANVFYGTSIPTIIMILKKKRTSKDILFIDASQEFKKEKTKNVLLPENIKKIFETYIAHKDVEKYAHLASYDEIVKNEYNLNIPRYVDTSEEEEQIDLDQINAEIADLDDQITELEKQLAELDAQLVKREI